MKLPSWWKKAVAALLLAAAAWFLFHVISDNWAAVRGYPWRVNVLLLAASIAALVAVLSFGVMLWGRVLRHFEHPPVTQGTLLRIWFLSNLTRYIPGTVFQFVTAAGLSRAAGLSATVLLTSLIVHTGFSVLSALVIAGATVVRPSFPALPAAVPVVEALAVAAGAALAVHPRFLNWAIGILPRLLRKPVIRWNGGWGDGLLLLGLSALSWLLYGGAYWMLLRSLTDVPASSLPMLSGVNSLSFVAGFLTPLPGGVGVREWAMTRLLLPLLTPGVAAVISVAARLWTIAAELSGGLLVLLLARGQLRADASDAAAGDAADDAASGADADGGATGDAAPVATRQ